MSLVQWRYRGFDSYRSGCFLSLVVLYMNIILSNLVNPLQALVMDLCIWISLQYISNTPVASAFEM